jgi:hypothetical protein
LNRGRLNKLGRIQATMAASPPNADPPMRARRPLVIPVFVFSSVGCVCGGNLKETQPAISIGTELDFGTVLDGTQKVMGLAVANQGAASLQITSAAIASGGTVFTVVSVPSQIAASDTGQIVVGYLPKGAGPDQGTMDVNSNDPKAGTITVTLLGGPNPPQLTLSPNPLSFVPAVNPIEKKMAYLHSTGFSAVTVSQMSILPGTNPDFSVVPPQLPASIAAGGQLAVEVDYARTQQHTANGTLQVVSDDPAGPRTMTLIPDPIAPCTSSSNCSGGEVCNNGICGPCTSNSQCPNGLMCNSGLCSACTGACAPGQMSSQACGNCGTQTRTCGTNCQWGAYGACMSTGTCAPGAMQACNTYGSQTCTGACTWSSCSCPMTPTCAPNAVQACGACGTQTCTACGQWETCVGQTGCVPGATRACNMYGTQTCSAACGWGACSCAAPPICTPNAVQPCGNCGTQTCDACGQWSNCGGEGVCAPNATQACNMYGTATCTSACAWSPCSCPMAPACTPDQTQTCADCSSQTCGNCGQWGVCQVVDAGCSSSGGASCGDGLYTIDGGAITYGPCCFGLVQLNVTQFYFFTDGGTLTVAPSPLWSPGSVGQPTMNGPGTVCDGGFDVSESYLNMGACYGTYTLNGTFIDPNTWTGTLDLQFDPTCGCAGTGDCFDQSFPVTAVK